MHQTRARMPRSPIIINPIIYKLQAKLGKLWVTCFLISLHWQICSHNHLPSDLHLDFSGSSDTCTGKRGGWPSGSQTLSRSLLFYLGSQRQREMAPLQFSTALCLSSYSSQGKGVWFSRRGQSLSSYQLFLTHTYGCPTNGSVPGVAGRDSHNKRSQMHRQTGTPGTNL